VVAVAAAAVAVAGAAVAAADEAAGAAVAVAAADEAADAAAAVVAVVAEVSVEGDRMIVSVASGKGGTGKTLVATSLALLWAGQGLRVTYVDADVEEPNGHLFLDLHSSRTERVGVPVPTLGGRMCGGNGACQRICSFNAIIAADRRVVVFPELCHGCGACVLACPEGFLKEESRGIGVTTAGSTRDPEIDFVAGELDVGEARAVPLIERITQRIGRLDGQIVIDSPPGTSCNVKAAIERADLALLVTEPTPFGLHDLELTVALARALEIRTAAVINRSDLGDDEVRGFLEREGIPVLAEIPFELSIAEAYARSRRVIDESASFRDEIASLAGKLLDLGGIES
jgi:MinD superfamily P-loop ATPase